MTVEACVPCETGSLRAPYRQTGLSFHEPCDEWGGAESRGNGARPVE